MQYPEFYKNMKGFTLIEVMLAIVILGVGLVGVAQLQGNSQKYSTLSKERVEAMTLAQQEMEELRHFATTTQYENQITNQLSGSSTNSVTINSQTTSYTMLSTVTPINNGLGADILVKVTWPDRDQNGSVSENTKIYLATKVSNAVPLFFGMSDAGPGTGEEIPNEPITFPDDPTIPGNTCECSTYVASVDVESGLVKVGGGGGMGMGGTSPPPPSGSAECTLCCNVAYVQLEDSAIQYASIHQSSESAFYYDDIAVNKYEDRVIDNNSFDLRYLIKGYKHPQYNHNDFFKTMGGMGGMGGTTYTRRAVCSYVSSTVSRMHHKWTTP